MPDPCDYKNDYKLIEEEVVRRQITRLVHFTPTMNLLSIFEQGALLSRHQLRKLSVEYPDLYLDDYVEINDKLRLDGLEDFINLSIQHSNHYLLKVFKESCHSWCDSWCVIAISPQYLYLKDTLFSIGNAASTASKRFGIDATYDKFSAMFNEKIYRENQLVYTRSRIKKCYPTDVQAEVLVRSKIAVEDIIEVYFESDEELHRSRGAIQILYSGEIPQFTVNGSMFHQRRV